MGADDSFARARPNKRDTFYLPFVVRLLLAVFGSGVFWFAVYKLLPDIETNWYRHSHWLFFVPAVGLLILALVVAIVCCWAALATRLVVTPGGIEYHEPGSTLSASWTDVVGIEDMLVGSGRGGSSCRETLLLKQSSVRATAPWSMVSLGSPRHLEIPIGLFAGNVRGSYLGRLIHTYTAHLRDFGRNEAEKGNPT